MLVTGMQIFLKLPKLASFFSAPEASLSWHQYHTLREIVQAMNSLQVGLIFGLGLHMLGLRRHYEVDLMTELVN